MPRAWPLIVLCACGGAHAGESVKLDAHQRENLGIATTALAAVDAPRSWAATAQVLDPTPLVSLAGELAAAQAAAEGSRHELDRALELHAADANVSQKAVEAARAQSLSDAGRAAALRAQLAGSWGRALAELPEQAREHLVHELAAGTQVLVRAETRLDSSKAQLKDARLQLLSGAESWEARVLGAATPGQGQALGGAYLLSAPAAPMLQPGRVLTAELRDRGAPLHGVKVPRGAIVRSQGEDWVFIEVAAGSFERRPLHAAAWLEDGCVVQEGVRAGERIVTTGAGLLLAAESAPAE